MFLENVPGEWGIVSMLVFVSRYSGVLMTFTVQRQLLGPMLR